MLRELSVRDLALIEDAHVELRPGFCAWTGETGAGKSLLLAALGLVLGQKASAELVRPGAAEARAAAVFELGESPARTAVETILGGPLDEETLILTRRISAQGRSLAQANGMPVTVNTLRQLAEVLVDLHGQHESRALLDPARQRQWLDAFGRRGDLVEAYRRCRETFVDLVRRQRDLKAAVERRQRERALLQFELEELNALDVRAGEVVELEREARRLASAQAIREAVTLGQDLLYDAEPSAQGMIERVARFLAPLGPMAPELAACSEELERVADQVREVAYTLRGLGRDWAHDDPRRLDEIEARLARYRKLASRFRCAPDELARRRETTAADLANLERDVEDAERLSGPIAEAFAALIAAASDLSKARRATAQAFARAVKEHLKGLGLGQARLGVEIETLTLDPNSADVPPEHGTDSIELVFAPNPGVPSRPLRRIASGGELARVTLAIKTVLAGVGGVPTLIFDEIDTGVGGRLGSALGRALASLARHHQVLCITHLPQLASYAEHQWAIRKRVEKGRTRTTIDELGETERVEELAAMLRGSSAAEGTRREVSAMLAEARSAGLGLRLGATG